MTAAGLQSTDSLLARYPGPVSLHPKTGRKLVSFAICLAFALVFGWLVFTGQLESGRRARWFDPFMMPITFAFFSALTLRGALMLAMPAIGALTLDARGLAIRHILSTKRLNWQDVLREFRAETTYWPLRVGGGLRRVTFEVIARSGWTGAPVKAARALHDNFALPPDQLAGLLNEWHRRALAENRPDSSSRVPSTGRPRRDT